MSSIQQVFNDIDAHLTGDDKPSKYLSQVISTKLLRDTYPFTMLSDLFNTEQSPVHHPEGNVLNHTLMVVDEAAKRRVQSEFPRAFMWAALLHDLGKAPTTKIRKGKLTSYDHDKVGEEMAYKFLIEFTEDKNFIESVTSLVRWHMQILFVAKDLPFASIKPMLAQVSVEEMSLFSLCDRLGRRQMTQDKIIEEQKNVKVFKTKCLKYNK